MNLRPKPLRTLRGWLEFPLRFSRTKQGQWHWVAGPHHVCCTSVSTKYEATIYLDEQAVYALLEDSPEECWEKMTSGRYTCGLTRSLAEPGKKRSSCVCSVCMYELVAALRQKRVYQLEIDHTKPIIVCSDGSIHQAESKTLADAKKMAKSLLDGSSSLTATIYAPHTKVSRPMPPIKMTRVKF